MTVRSLEPLITSESSAVVEMDIMVVNSGFIAALRLVRSI